MRLVHLAVELLREGDLPSARRTAAVAAISEADEPETDMYTYQLAQRLNRALGEVVGVVVVVEHKPSNGAQLLLFQRPDGSREGA
jgi:hypothetical protein